MLNSTGVTILLALLIAVLLLTGCDRKSSEEKFVASQRVDLFREGGINTIATAEVPAISADTAAKYSTVNGLATQLKLVDSAVRNGVYLYSAAIVKVEKGVPESCRKKEYFIAYERLPALRDTVGRFYFIPVVNHRIIKDNLAVRWQWYPGAPVNGNR